MNTDRGRWADTLQLQPTADREHHAEHGDSGVITEAETSNTLFEQHLERLSIEELSTSALNYGRC